MAHDQHQTANEAADWLAVIEATLGGWIKQRGSPTFETGNAWRVAASGTDAPISGHRMLVAGPTETRVASTADPAAWRESGA